ncbi:MAG: hypothetical protein ACU0CI_00545 [Shimia sp.]
MKAETAPASRTVLCVGDVSGWATRALPGKGSECIFAAFDDITSELIQETDPELIVSELWCHGHDAADLAVLLHELSYSGRYIALSPKLPKPSMVVREVQAAAPSLDFELVETG